MTIDLKSAFANLLARQGLITIGRRHGRKAAAAILAGGLSFLGGVEAPAVELLQNGSFEMNNGFNGDNEDFSWVNPDGIPVFDVYDHSSQVYYEGSAPPDAGNWYFHTVGVTNSEGVHQDVDLTAAATPTQIDDGTVAFNLSGWLSGWTASDDHPDIVLDFFDASGNANGGSLVIDGADFGPGSFFKTTVTGDDPSTFANPIAAWKQYEAIQGVPVGSRSARVTILQDTLTGNGNDNYVDLLSLDVADTGIPQFLKIQVNTTNGLVSMVNQSPQDVEINFYEILSDSGSLSVDGWNSYDDQDLDSVGSLPGESWDEGGGSHNGWLVEAFLSGTSTFSAGGNSETIGQAFDVGVGAQDLEFFYAGSDGQRFRGIVEYVTGISGDFDGNGSYECNDIDMLTMAIAAGTNESAFDLTGDGIVNLADRDAWLVEAGAAELASGNPFLVGDANLDGVVDVSDFNRWNGNKFSMTSAWCSGDFNADGVVDVSDFNLWNGNKFSMSDVATVPEPNPFVWVVSLFAALVIRRK